MQVNQPAEQTPDLSAEMNHRELDPASETGQARDTDQLRQRIADGYYEQEHVEEVLARRLMKAHF